MMNILITGFDPFGGEAINPALEVVKLLPDEIDGHKIDKLEIPTVFHKSKEVVKEQLNQKEYDIVLAIGQAAAYFSNLPVKRMTEGIKSQGVPARLSNTAGTFVCNHILYQLGYLEATQFPNIKFGFIHVPFIPEQVTDKVEKPSMSLETIAKGLKVALEVVIESDKDIKVALGETH